MLWLNETENAMRRLSLDCTIFFGCILATLAVKELKVECDWCSVDRSVNGCICVAYISECFRVLVIRGFTDWRWNNFYGYTLLILTHGVEITSPRQDNAGFPSTCQLHVHEDLASPVGPLFRPSHQAATDRDDSLGRFRRGCLVRWIWAMQSRAVCLPSATGRKW